MTRVIRTVSRRRFGGTNLLREHVVVEVPATESTWLANCARIAAEVTSEKRGTVSASDVDAACRRILGLKG